MAQQTPVTFVNRKGLRLFGVLHTPADPRPGDLIVVLLSPGVKMRVGPQRLYVELAEVLGEMGLSVLRFDSHGLGDSEGTLPEEQLRDVYNHIQIGRYVEDTIDAMDWIQETCGPRRFLLAGLCGGAITGLLAGERDSRVVGLLALGIPTALAGLTADTSRYMTLGQLEASQKMYVKRLASPRAWFRLLTFQTDNRLIWKMLAQRMRQLLGSRPEPQSVAPEDDNANPLFPRAVFKMLSSRRPMLLLFGGADRLHFEYEEKFACRHRDRLAALPPLVDVHVIESANHVLSLAEWRKEMVEHSTRWLHEHFSADLRTPSNDTDGTSRLPSALEVRARPLQGRVS